MKITVNDITLSSDFLSIPAQGSANIPIEIENLSEKYIDYALIPCVGWLENGVVVSTTRAVTSVDEKKIFTLPAESFKNAGAIYISIGLVKDYIKIKTNEIVLFVGEAPDADVELPADGTWETAVSSLVSSLFNERFENEINKILENAQALNQETENLQRQINNAINYLGDYEWSGTQIRFKKGDGTWGDYKDIAGEFAKQSDMSDVLNSYKSVTSLTKQMFLLMHPVGSILTTASEQNPQLTFGGTWELVEKNNPIYMVSGTRVLTGNGLNRLYFDTSANVVNMFYTKYKFKPDIMDVNINFYNGDADATDRGVIGADISASGSNVNAVFNAGHTGTIRINYGFIAANTSVTIYKWKRTA